MSYSILEWTQQAKSSACFLPLYTVRGTLTKLSGLIMEAVGLRLPIGTVCEVSSISANAKIRAEVVGFNKERIYLMALEQSGAIMPGAEVTPIYYTGRCPDLYQKSPTQIGVSGLRKKLPVGDDLLGRVVDASGEPLDGLGPLSPDYLTELEHTQINPLSRAPIEQPLDVGVRAINTLLTVGRGQRIGIFAGSGVGKSVLLGMMSKYTEADRIVVGLIGERGREVKEFINNILGEEGLRRSVVVAAPADISPVLRLQAASYTHSIAEYFRDQGHNVLMIMDSLTRYAMAQREIALAIGEPPATKGYPPSVFAKLPALVERAGNGQTGQGSITAFYTVLTEGDDQQDPIADAARGILDGHFVLTRELAESGHYPAIDIGQSISRVMPTIVSKEHMNAQMLLKRMFNKVNQNRELITVGAYTEGADLELDHALKAYGALEALLQQSQDEKSSFNDGLSKIKLMLPKIFNGVNK